MSVKKNLIDFASNDYLGFARSETLKALFLKKLSTLPTLGSTGSRLLTGNSAFCEKLEKKIASYHREEAGLLFASGYCANLGLISAVCSREDSILYDAKVHASMRDAMVLSRARHYKFHHNDPTHLESLLKKQSKPCFVVIESLYSTDGTLAPLKEICAVCERYGARLIVDEAHATGVFGPGLVKEPVFARMHSFGKALGVGGAIILGSSQLRDYLITVCRPFIYTTALFFPQLLAIECAYEMLQQTSQNALLSLCHYAGSTTPILRFSAHHWLRPPETFGLDVRLLRYPTVERGEECFRICIHTFNTKEEIDRLYAWLNCRRN